jgi:hypothetical protein
MADGDGETDVADISGNGKGVALNVDAPQAFIDDLMLPTAPNAFDRVRSVAGLEDRLATAASAGIKPIATRAALALETVSVNLLRYLHESGRSGVFKFISAATFLATYGVAATIAVAADTQKGVIVAPSTDITGASGVWVRQFDGSPILPGWFGAIADDDDAATGTNNSAAFSAMFATQQVLSRSGLPAGNPTIYRGGYEILIVGHFYVGTVTHEPLTTFKMRGIGGIGWGSASRIRFGVNTTGLRAQAYNTSGASTVDGANHYSGDSWVVQDIYFVGAYNTAAPNEGEYHGIHIKRPVNLIRCTFDGFQGNGFHCDTSGAPAGGNANLSKIENCHFVNNRHGRFMKGGDSNACLFIGCRYDYNRAWGVRDESFLGNTEIGSHTAGNGQIAGMPAYTMAHYLGNWFAVVEGQEVAAATTAPPATATDSAVWYWVSAGIPSPGVIPTWVSGTQTWRTGGPYFTNNLNASNEFIGCYSEGGQGPSQATYPTVFRGGALASGIKGSATFSRNFQGWWRVGSGINRGLIADGASIINGSLTVDGGTGNGALNIQGAGNAPQISLIEAGVTYGYILMLGSSMYINASNTMNLRINGTDIASIQSDGLHITGLGAFSGALTASNLSGTNTGDQTTITGNAGSATVLQTGRNISISGGGITAAGVSFNGSAAIALNASVDAGHITFARMANLAANSIIGNNTGAGATPIALTGAQVTAMLSAAVSGGAQGAMSGQDKARLDASFTFYRSLLDCSGWLTAADAAATYGMGQGDKCAVSGTGTQYPLNSIYIAAADYPAIGTLNPKLRIRVQIHCNDVAPGVTFTVALHPITRPATSGGAGLCIYTIGAAVASSGIAIATPAADSSNTAVGAADIALPADGHYVIGVTTSGGALAASSHVHISAILQMRYA